MRLSKEQSPYCEVRLVDLDDAEVPDGRPGELCMRGPTLFSGYWRAPAETAHDFRGGWFHMGDDFVRNPDGTLDFVDRVKYLIKSGGENIYPAEIERVLLTVPRVVDVAVVRRRDRPLGRGARGVSSRGATTRSRRPTCGLAAAKALAGYKQPKAIVFLGSGRVSPERVGERSSGTSSSAARCPRAEGSAWAPRGATLARWCAVTKTDEEPRKRRRGRLHAAPLQRVQVPSRQASEHRVAGPSRARETSTAERGVKSP